MSGNVRGSETADNAEAQRLREFDCRQHDSQTFIDPDCGGFIRCLKCGKEIDCEDPDGDLG